MRELVEYREALTIRVVILVHDDKDLTASFESSTSLVGIELIALFHFDVQASGQREHIDWRSGNVADELLCPKDDRQLVHVELKGPNHLYGP